MCQKLEPKYEKKMRKRWKNGTTFTASLIDLTRGEEGTRTYEATPPTRQPEIILGGIQQRARGRQEQTLS